MNLILGRVHQLFYRKGFGFVTAPDHGDFFLELRGFCRLVKKDGEALLVPVGAQDCRLWEGNEIAFTVSPQTDLFNPKHLPRIDRFCHIADYDEIFNPPKVTPVEPPKVTVQERAARVGLARQVGEPSYHFKVRVREEERRRGIPSP